MIRCSQHVYTDMYHVVYINCQHTRTEQCINNIFKRRLTVIVLNIMIMMITFLANQWLQQKIVFLNKIKKNFNLGYLIAFFVRVEIPRPIALMINSLRHFFEMNQKNEQRKKNVIGNTQRARITRIKEHQRNKKKVKKKLQQQNKLLHFAKRYNFNQKGIYFVTLNRTHQSH